MPELGSIGYWHYWAVFLLAVTPDDKLYYTASGAKRLVLMDADARQNALREAHDRHGAHQGQTRTLSHLSNDYYWCAMTDDVKQWVCILLRSFI